MAYNKHNFKDGQVLRADALNEMDEQIEQLNNDLSQKIGHISMSIAGTDIRKVDTNGCYYSEDIYFTLPTGAVPISVTIYNGFDAGVTAIMRSSSFVLQCSKPTTIINNPNRMVRIAWYRP